MSKTQQDPEEFSKNKRVITRKDEDLELIKQLQLSPDAFITERATDEGLDKISLKIKLIGGGIFLLKTMFQP